MRFLKLMVVAAFVAAAPTTATLSAAQETAAKARPMFAIVYRAGPTWKPDVAMEKQGLRDHYFYVKALHERGDVIYAGPWGSDGGLMLIHSADQAAAEQVVREDPAVKAGLFIGEVRAFTAAFAGVRAAQL